MGKEPLQKFKDTHDFIKKNSYNSENNLTLGRKHYNTPLLLGLITALNETNILYFGKNNLGKTISSLFFSTPYDIVNLLSIKGKEMLNGDYYTYSKTKVVNKINKVPTDVQNDLCSLNSDLLFITKKHNTTWDNNIVPPLLEKISLYVNSENYRFEGKESLIYEDLSKAYLDMLQVKGLIMEEFEYGSRVLKEEFRNKIFNDYNLELLTEEDFFKIKTQINEISLETTWQNNLINNYSKTLAWLDNKKEATSKHSDMIIPYMTWHTINSNENLHEESKQKKKNKSIYNLLGKSEINNLAKTCCELFVPENTNPRVKKAFETGTSLLLKDFLKKYIGK